jgi:RNA polymerase sigma-54 factor
MSQTSFNMVQTARMAQKMLPQQIAAATFLQATLPELRAEIRARQEKNPAIEDVKWHTESLLSSVMADPARGKSSADYDTPLDFAPDGTAAARTLGADDGHLETFLGNMESATMDDADDARLSRVREGHSLWDATREARRQYLFDSAVATESLDEYLRRQIALSDFSPREREIAACVVANLDAAGFFCGSLPDIVMSTGASEKDIRDVQRRICATFDPPGIAAADLKECLLAQMERLDDSPWEDEVRAVIRGHLDDFLSGRDEAVRQALGLCVEDWRAVKAAFKVFSRKPALQQRSGAHAGAGRQVGGEASPYIYPEVHAVCVKGQWRAVVTDGGIPKILISKDMRQLADDPSVSAQDRSVIRTYIRDAEELEDMLDKRQEKIKAVAQAIIDAQPGFFETGPEGLAPLSMARIAEKTGLDISTISRAVGGKYMTTPFGTVELRRFFVSGVATAAGVVSPVRIKARIRALIAAEDTARPLSDDALAKKLAAEGFKISRRAVTNYRKAENIPDSSARRRR